MSAATAAKPDPEPFVVRVRRIQQLLTKAITRAGLRDDPYGEVLDAMGMALGVIAEMPDQVQTARQPLDPEALRLLTDRVARAGVAAMERRADVLARTVTMRVVAAGFVVLATVLAGGGAAGWLARGWYEPMPPVDVTNCVPAPQPQGGVAFSCTFWARLPR